MKTLLLILVSLFLVANAQSQCVVNNEDDYTITAEFTPTKMIPQGGCTEGPGNFKVEVAYKIKVEGSNIPENPVNFYQITLSCGNVKLQASGNLPITRDSISGTYITAENYFKNGDCASSTPESLDCIGDNNIRFIGNGPNRLRFNTRCASLKQETQVKFESLNALLNNAQYVIDWKITPSPEVAYFLVEKSFDNNDFTIISDKLEYNRDKPSQYVDKSEDIFKQQSFYRIRTVSENGSITNSSTFTGGQF